MYITDQSTANYERLQFHRDSSVPRPSAGTRLRSLDKSSQATRGNEEGGCGVQRNKFFLGLFFSLPICFLLWGIILWFLYAILF
jgi:hypothetical protein